MALETLTVTTTLDQNDGSTTGGLSLRDALMIANANTNNEYIIELQGGSDYFLSLGSGGNEDVASGDLDIYAGANITIRSLGNQPARIDATSIPNGDRVFNVLDDGTLTLEKVIVSGGSRSNGGGIYVGDGVFGGNNATLNLLNTTITDNIASSSGGGIFNFFGNVSIYNSSIISNFANGSGGGIYNYGSNLTIVNSTISDNVANGSGGGINNRNDTHNRSNNVMIVNSTITGNDADNNSDSSSVNIDNGGGINSYGGYDGTIVLKNSIIANNTRDGGTVKSDLSGSDFQGNLHNLVGVLDGVSNSTIGTGSDIVLGANGSAGLGALQNNGGFTPTHALLAGSPAIDAGNSSLQPVDAFDMDGDGDTGESIPYDQIGNNRLNNSTVDIGAVEFYVSLSVNDVSVAEGGINGTDFVFEVSLNASLNQVVTVDYATVNDSAMAGSDYDSTSGTLTFNPGETRKNVTVKVLGDDTVEPDERFFLSLSNSQNALISDGTGEGIIINDNFIKPTISINDVVVDEGNTGRKDAVFTITLSEPTTVPVTVSYDLEDGTATVGNDYLASQGEVIFQPSETSKTISIGVLGDTDIENNETFSVKLSNPINATFNKESGTGTITNDDSVIDSVRLSVNDVSAMEGGINGTDFVFEVSLNASLNEVVTVDYATVNDSAMAGSDYNSTSGTLTFNPGETRKNVTVKVLGDDTVEPDERFFLSLSNSQNALISDDTGEGIIINDNFIKPTISINDVVVDEGNTGRKDAVFTITLSQPTTVPVTVSYGLEDGSAIVGNDYLASQGEVIFQPSETSKTISIGVLGDTDIENNETFSVKLSNPVNATFNKGSGTGTITNDDSRTSGDLLINRFQNTVRPGTYLFANERESANIRNNFRNFTEEGTAFSVFSQPGDDLIRINRFQNRNVAGTYLYANEQESVNIRRDFPNFMEEGIAFYAYGADANKGLDFYRFQNTQQPGTYIFVGEDERNNIVANFPQFRLEGVAFEVG